MKKHYHYTSIIQEIDFVTGKHIGYKITGEITVPFRLFYQRVSKFGKGFVWAIKHYPVNKEPFQVYITTLNQSKLRKVGFNKYQIEKILFLKTKQYDIEY